MRSITLLIFVSLAFVSFAQGPVVESIEVRVINIDTIVTDKSGNPVTGLTREDFELFEDGKKQPITNFYEIRGRGVEAAAPAADSPVQARPRQFFLFVDVSSIHPHTRDVLAASIRKFAETGIQPGDQASVIAWNEQIHILAPLTSNRDELLAAVEKVKELSSPNVFRNEINNVQQYCTRMLALAKAGTLPFQSAYLDCINMASSEATLTVNRSRRLLNALNLTLSIMGGGEAKKALIVAGAQLPRRPGLDTFGWANSLFAPFMRGFNRPQEQFQENHLTMADAIAEFARNANAAGVTTYLVNAPGVADPMSVVNKELVADEGADFRNAGNTSDAFEEIARMTGGAAMRTRFDFDTLFTTVTRDLGSYYSLGYRPTQRGRTPHRIEVRAKNRAYKVRSRQTWTDKTADDQMNDRVVANVFNPAPAGEFPVRIHAGKASGSGDTRTVQLEIVFPSSAITLLPTAGNLEGGFTVWLTVGDRRGALSPVSRSPQAIRLPAAEEKTFRAEPIVFTVDLTVRHGENIISVAVVDNVSGNAAFARVEAPWQDDGLVQKFPGRD